MGHIKLTFIFIFLSLSVASCAKIKIWMDNSGLGDYSEMILSEAPPTDLPEKSVQPPTPDRSSPISPRVSQLHQWHLKDVSIQRKVELPSKIRHSNGTADTSVFYVYSQTGLKNANVILWIPGFGVSNFAFRFIKTFFKNELEAGYTVVFYNIPYHLNRVEDGKEPGQGLVTADNHKNIQLVHHVLDEIDGIIHYLEKERVQSISGWGGSIGAVFLWLASADYPFEHLTLMIPVVDWNTLIFHEQMTPVRDKMNQSGISDESLKRLYADISPINVPTQTPAHHIQILYAKLDQFTPESKTVAFAQKWKITNVIGYNESHASILINRQVYRDNQTFLHSIKP